jgi:hypothetical protein
MKTILKIFIFLLLIFSCELRAQTAYQHISDENIYSFIDDMASLQLIQVNTSVKPYSRARIAQWLNQVDMQKEQLSRSQQARLKNFMAEYALESGNLKTGKATLFKKDSTYSVHMLPPEITWRDPFFRAVMRPVYGIRYFSNSKGSFYQSYGGLEGIAYMGKSWSGYASLRDNHNSSEPLSLPSYFTQEPGGAFKNGTDFSEMRGGITTTWKWGTFGLVKDNVKWGDSYNGSNILSGRTPSFTMLKLHLNPVKWLEFDYFHGWLVSMVIDSAQSYMTSNGYRAVYRSKYIASNLFTFKPFKSLNLSIGNSIVYSDVPVQPAYLIPFFFYKSVDHTINRDIENQNSSVFINLSSRQIKHLHLYTSVFIDEFSIERISDPERTNFVSYKGGAAVTGWPLKDLFFASEFTRTTPITYKHRIPATTFESNRFNLGHYMKDNSQDFYFVARYSPWSTLQLKASYLYAVHGNEYAYDVHGSVDVDMYPVLEDKTWTNQTIAIRAEMLPITNIRIFAEYTYSNIEGYDVDGRSAQYYLNRYTPQYLHGISNTIMVGFGMGF